MATAQNVGADLKVCPGPTTWEENWARQLRRWALVLLLVGILWRVVRYLLRFPVWGDETFICLSLVDQSYLNLMGRLRCSQVAPLLFLWGEFTVYLTLGTSDLAMRFLPFAAGLAGLLLFWRLAHRLLPPLGATLAVGFLAVAKWPVSMSTNIKPYSLDLCMSTLLLLLAVEWLRKPERLRWLVLLALSVPFALLASYPAVFVAGSISVVLLPAVWKQPGQKARIWFVVYNALMFSGFFCSYLVVGISQLDRSTGAVNSFLQSYWAHGFPPSRPLELLWWLLMINTGRMMAYPIGGDHGLSIFTLLLFLTGLVWLWRSGRKSVVVLCIGPFVLGMIAAVLRRYPYGGCCRLSQHVAPIICLAAGAGLAVLIGRLRSYHRQQRALRLAGAAFVAVGLGGIMLDMLYPYHGDTDVWWRSIVRNITSQCGPDDQIVVLNGEAETDVVIRWELVKFRERGGLVSWNAKVNMDRLRTTTGQLWVLKMDGSTRNFDVISPLVTQSRRTWILANRIPYTILPKSRKDPPLHCEVCRWVCPGTPGLPADLAAVSCWP